MNIILLGLPGAGKGTHGIKLSEKYRMYHLSSGKVLRKVARQNTSIGEVVKRYINRGLLVPDEIILKLMGARIEKLAGKSKIIDGFPRDIRQAYFLDDIMERIEEEIDLCIYLKVEFQELVTRLTGRRVCRFDGSIYHVKYDPPQKEGVCDKCGASLYQRDDDKEEIVKKRIKASAGKINKLKDYYENRGILKVIEGTKKSPDEVQIKIENIIES